MKEKLTNVTLSFTSILLGVFIVEVGLQVMGYSPKIARHNYKNEPVMLAFDSLLGWKNKPGAYTYPSYKHSSDDSIHVTILSDGSRKTGELIGPGDDIDSLKKIVFVGGSFTQGMAIKDSETMAWKVQAIFPEYSVKNLGVPAYGTYQSSLSLENYFRQGQKTETVFYGLLTHHLERNVATSAWKDILTDIENRKHVLVPSIILKDNQLVRKEPTTYDRIPLGSVFSVTKLIERNVFNFQSKVSDNARKRILLMLLEEMRQLCLNNGAEFVILGFDLKKDLESLLENNNHVLINYKWDQKDSTMYVVGEGHPSGKTNTMWAQQVVNYLRTKSN